MNVRNFLFSLFITVMLCTSGVFAQTTHMGVPAKDMVVLTANCINDDPTPQCSSSESFGATSGAKYRRVLADGSVEDVDFSIPARKVLVITEYEWRYHETPVEENSVNDPLDVSVSHDGLVPSLVSLSQSSLRVTPTDAIIFTQGNASGATQMTSGFVTSVVPRWLLNRVIVGDSVSSRRFRIVIRGYLLDVP